MMTGLFSPRLTRIAFIIMALVSPEIFSRYAEAADPEKQSPAGHSTFDPVFFSPNAARQIDLKRFDQGATALPGSYPSDIYVNDIKVASDTVEFREQPDKTVQACLKSSTFGLLGLDYSKLNSAALSETADGKDDCLLLSNVLPGAGVAFDSGAQRLDLTISQDLLAKYGRGYVSPALWDSGVPSLQLGYTSNFYSTHNSGQTTQTGYVGLNAGMNIDGWYLRHNGNYNWQDGGDKSYQSINTYVQHDIVPLGGRVILGENNTSGQLFDTLPFRGAELVDDERMLPQSRRGFAPDIRGIARTNAKVTVRQNGQIIYETTVSPGPFDINDLYPTGYGGDLDVTVTEADGSLQTFSVPFASVNQLLRPGAHHYDVVVGNLNDDSISDNPALYQLTYQRGLTNLLTGYSGMQVSQDYYALQIGSALNFDIGAIAFDVTQARMHLDTDRYINEGFENSMSGQSYRISYSKYIEDTSSNLSIAAYRFATAGYMDFRTAMQTIDNIQHGSDPNDIYRAKNKLTVTANQGLMPGWGQFFVTGYVQDYWNEDTSSDVQYQLGYSNSFRSVSYSFNAGRSRNGDGDMETTFLFNMSVPLGNSDKTNVPQLNASVSRDGSGTVGETVGISGTAGQDSEYSYGLSGTNYNHGVGSGGTASGQYRSPYTNINASVGVGDGYDSYSGGLSGTIIGYQGGVVMTPYTSDTFAIVEADGATGAKVSSYSGVKVDPWGHAAVPYLNPYEMNEVTLDPKGISYDVELENTSQKVAPYSGAIVRLKYATTRGYPLLIASKQVDGTPLPFGAEVRDENNNAVGSVGQGSQVYARVMKEQGSLMIKWGNTRRQQCSITYHMPPQPKQAAKNALMRFTSVCSSI